MVRSGFKMKGYTYPGQSPMKNVDPPSDKNELVKHTYPAGSIGARGEGWEGVSDRDVYVSKGTKRLIEAGAPKDIIAKSKLRDIELFKAQEK